MQKNIAAPGAEPPAAAPIPLYTPRKPPEARNPFGACNRVLMVSSGKSATSTLVPAMPPDSMAHVNDGELVCSAGGRSCMGLLTRDFQTVPLSTQETWGRPLGLAKVGSLAAWACSTGACVERHGGTRMIAAAASARRGPGRSVQRGC